MRRFVLVVLLLVLWAPAAKAWTWPVQGPVLLGFTFDSAHPYAGGEHRGIDIGAGTGTAVVAPAGGVVTFAGTVPASGKSVTIATPDGYSVTLTHLGSVGVSKGATVGEGDAVGTVGPSGTPELNVPYLYMGVRTTVDAQGYLDPLSFLPALPPPTTSAPTPPPPPAATDSAAPPPPETQTAGDGSAPGSSDTAAPPAEATADAPSDGSPAAGADPAASSADGTSGDTGSDVAAAPVETTADDSAAPADSGAGPTSDDAAAGSGPDASATADDGAAAPASDAAADPGDGSTADTGAAPVEAPPPAPPPPPAAAPAPAAPAPPAIVVTPVVEDVPIDAVEPEPTAAAPGTAPPAEPAPATPAQAADWVDDAFVVHAAPVGVAIAFVPRLTRPVPVVRRAHTVRRQAPRPSAPRPAGRPLHAARQQSTHRHAEARSAGLARPRPRRHAATPAPPHRRHRAGRPLPVLVLLGLAALFVAVAVGGVRMISSRSQPEGERSDAAEDPRRGRVAVCERPEAPRPCGGPRRAVGHLRALPPAARQRRPDGERDGRARHARHGLRRSRRRVSA